MKRIYCALLLLIVPLTAHAQATLRGTVVDRQTGSPVSGALVAANGNSTSAATDATGNFTLNSATTITSVTVVSVGYAALA